MHHGCLARKGLTSAELAGVEKADGTWHHHEDGTIDLDIGVEYQT